MWASARGSGTVRDEEQDFLFRLGEKLIEKRRAVALGVAAATVVFGPPPLRMARIRV